MVFILCGIVCIVIAITVPALILSMECLLGLTPLSSRSFPHGTEASAIILIPAHDEASGIEMAIQQIQREMSSMHSILVVADNCTDNTAVIARRSGASVIERNCPRLRGKGHALAFGIDYISTLPHQPDVIVVLDADCQLSGLKELVSQCYNEEVPFQCVYLMNLQPTSCIRTRISAFAFRIKNLVRLRGLHRLGGPSLLTGSGMAFPWKDIHNMDWGGGEIVEDLASGLKMIENGSSAPQFTESAQVFSSFSVDLSATKGQSRRWEHGQLGQLISMAPRLLFTGVVRRNRKAFIVGMDVLIPPISFLCLLVAAGFLVSLIAALVIEFYLPLIILSAVSGILCFSLGLAWGIEGRRILPARYVFSVPRYILSKAHVYLSFVFDRESAWVRTSRS